jgi:hypothetical protein
MNNYTLFSLLLFFCCLPARAQPVVTGKVTDHQQQPLPGVNVTLKGTTQGTTTAADGTYSVGAGRGAVLVFSYLGFRSQEVTLANQTLLTSASTRAIATERGGGDGPRRGKGQKSPGLLGH